MLWTFHIEGDNIRSSLAFVGQGVEGAEAEAGHGYGEHFSLWALPGQGVPALEGHGDGEYCINSALPRSPDALEAIISRRCSMVEGPSLRNSSISSESLCIVLAKASAIGKCAIASPSAREATEYDRVLPPAVASPNDSVSIGTASYQPGAGPGTPEEEAYSGKRFRLSAGGGALCEKGPFE